MTWVVASLSGLVQQIAVSYVSNGYFFYVSGFVPEGKEARLVDQKLTEKYRIGVSKHVRYRDKQRGGARLAYVRLDQRFFILATHGEHPFFVEEGKTIRDVRRVPLKVGGYAIGHRNGHVSVRIEEKVYKALKVEFLEAATKRGREELEQMFRGLSFEPYAPVRNQLWQLFRAVDQKRKTAGRKRLDPECLPGLRRSVKSRS